VFFEGERAIQNEARYRQMLERVMDPRTAEAAAKNYRVADFATPNDAAIALWTDALFECPARGFAETLSSQARVFLYSFESELAISEKLTGATSLRTDRCMLWDALCVPQSV
jgi:carboxylesterase type B